MNAAAAAPWRHLAATRIHGSHANPPISAARAKEASPATNRRRLPHRSPTRPNSSSRPPKTRAYPLRIHCTPVPEKPSSLRITGSAMLTIVMSTTALDEAKHSTMSVSRLPDASRTSVAVPCRPSRYRRGPLPPPSSGAAIPDSWLPIKQRFASYQTRTTSYC
jgi:hypothetical protein